MRISILILILVFLTISACKNTPEIIEPKTENPQAQESSGVEEQNVYEPKLPTKVVDIAGHRLRVEIADNPQSRSRGLMFRNYLPDSVGMLFIFDEVGQHPFWMKNTFIPLSIAFIGEDSIITDIKWMKPHDTNSYYPSKPIKYTIEVNRGWFMKRDIKPGMKVNL